MDVGLQTLDKSLESHVRLAIMSTLSRREEVSFKELKSLLLLSDGNLATHIRKLESLEYIQVRKKFIDRKPSTTYYATIKGESAFTAHTSALKALIISR